MAVYNVEPFLREAIDSIIGQNIGFSSIQLILVDDGSTDGSGNICDEYGAQYPDNILVIHKENGGVSSARNEGLRYVEGQYINFMDADDKLSENTVKAASNFLDCHYEETDIVAFPMIFFDGRNGEHILNYKFNKGNRVIDLDKEWQNPQLSMSSAFVKAECILSCGFDTRLAYFEDAQVVQKILASKAALGVIKDAKYWYRRRSTGEQSAVQSAIYRKERYLPCMQFFHHELIDYFLNKYHYIPRFVQFLLMYDLQWRIDQREIPDEVLSQEEREAYYCAIKKTLENIDDDIIMAQRNIFREQKFFTLSWKYGIVPTPIKRGSDVVFAFPGGAIIKLSECPVSFDFITPTDSGFILEGVVSVLSNLWENAKMFIRANDTIYPCEIFETSANTVALNEVIQHGIGFNAKLLLDKNSAYDISVILNVCGVNIPLRNVRYGQFFPISKKYKNAYAYCGNWVIQQAPRGICVTPCKMLRRAELEKTFCKEVWKTNAKGGRNAVIARFLSRILSKLKKRPIWLISDRAGKAGDNGEALFRYMQKNHPEIKSFFVINYDCPDYKRIKKVGPVLAKDSRWHKLLLIISNYNISSQVEIDIYNPFYKYRDAYQDIISSKKFVFLQHGVTKDDLSNYLHRRNKNLAGFVTSARPEWLSIVNGNYGYSQEQIWLTGLPRFDRLYSQSSKMIAIVPTWRKYLMGKLNKHTGLWTIGPDFMKSPFLHFYSELMNDRRLLDAAKLYGYTLAFMPHPNLWPHVGLFSADPQVKLLDSGMEYRDLFAQCSLLVTDYSSAVFDFAYLRKPLFYTQFDREAFFAGDHTYKKGYFDYERDGFGEVEYTLEGTVDRIIEYMENGCQLKEKYRDRIDNFFAFNDQNNCQRVYEKIMELNQYGTLREAQNKTCPP